jgi:glycine cleavage system H protein
MAFNTPDDLQYTRSHEWLRVEGETATTGISDYAQDALGDVVYIDLPEVGTEFEAGAVFGAVESVKAASDLYMPAGGTISEVNTALLDHPELINSDPYGAGWLIKFVVAEGVAALMSAEAYGRHVEASGH